MISIISGFRRPAYAGPTIAFDGATILGEKNMKITVTAFALLTTLLATSVYAADGGEAANKTLPVASQKNAAVADARETVVLPAFERDRILASMRRFLKGTQKIVEGLALDDMKMVIQGARSTDAQPLSEASRKARENCPKGCTELCEAMHSGFSSIAAEAEAGKNKQVILEKLSGTLQRCTACHDTYRYDMRPAANELPSLGKP